MTREEKLLEIYRRLWTDVNVASDFCDDWHWIGQELQDGREDNVTDAMLDMVLTWMEEK